MLDKLGLKGDIFGMSTIVDNRVSQVYSVSNDVELDGGVGRKHNWFRNGACDNVAYLKRQMYRESMPHSTIINSKVGLAYGKGLGFRVAETSCKYVNGRYVKYEGNKDLEAFELWQKSILTDKWFKEALQQLFTYGGVYTLPFYSFGGDPKVKIEHRLDRILVEKHFNMRFGADRQFGIDGFESKKYYLSEDFEKVRRKTVSYETRAKKGGIVEIPRFTEKVIENEDTGVYASHTGIITDYRDYYPTPYWETEESINAICLSLVLGLDDKNKVINGFSADYIIVKYRKEDPDKDAEYLKKKEEVDAIKGNYTGFSGSKIAILWATPGKDDKGNVVLHKPIEIIEIPSIDPKSMIEIRKNILNTIWAAHGISAPEGFGFSSSEGSGNGLNSQQEYMMQGLVNTFKSRIAPVRDIAVKWYNNFILLNGWSIEAYPIEDLPKRQMSDEHAEKILTINELRERQGLGKLESGGDRLLNQQIDVTE